MLAGEFDTFGTDEVEFLKRKCEFGAYNLFELVEDGSAAKLNDILFIDIFPLDDILFRELMPSRVLDRVDLIIIINSFLEKM